MGIPTDSRTLLLCLATATGLYAQVDAREIVRHAVAADELNWKFARNYESQQRVELRRLDAQGRVKSSEVRSYDVTLQQGTPYRQLVQMDGHALPATEEKKEQERLVKTIADRRQETPQERARRLSAYERRPDWQREAWRELPDAFEFRLTGESGPEGHRLFIIEATPRPGYQPASGTAKLFRALKGRLWVDQQDRQIAKLEVEVIDTLCVGLFLVRVAKGSHATVEWTSAGDGVWLLDRLQVFASARLGLVQVLHFEQTMHYSRYRSVPADTVTIQTAEDRNVRGAHRKGDAKATP